MQNEDQPALVPCGDRQVGEDLWHRYGAERGVWTENMLKALDKGVKGNKWFSLIDKVASERTLGMAWAKVESNAGSCGVDSMSVEHFAKDSDHRLLVVNECLREGNYQPNTIRRVLIPKPGSKEKRPLGIPTVADRIVQTAIRMVIEPIFEREFCDTSYGFRPGRGCKDALREVERHLRGGLCHVVDVDIRGYFDNIPHDRLMGLVREHIADGKVLGLIEGYLKAGVQMEDGRKVMPQTGTPQGGVISPLLANIYLNPLDWLLKQLGLVSVRYADDIVILAADAATAEQALWELARWTGEAGLELHPEKTRTVDMSTSGAYFDILGYRFQRSAKGKMLRLVRPKSKSSLRAKLRKPTKRSNAHGLKEIIDQINPILRGWSGYFLQAHPNVHREMDGWVRMRLRSILRKRRKGKGRGRGSDHQRWPNAYFETLGLFSLEAAREEVFSLLRGATR